MTADTAEKAIGKVTHFFPKVGVAVVALNERLARGERVAFRGATTDFTQTVESMEIDHAAVEAAEAGQEVGMKVNERVREGDEVFRV